MKQKIYDLIQSYKSFKMRSSLNKQLRALLIGGVTPFIIIIIVLLCMLASFNHEYTVSLRNATTAGEFNFNFKDTLDLDMYYFVVGNENMKHLPLEEVDHAEEVIHRLQKTTTLTENQWRIRSMLHLCSRLKECMVDIKKTKSYDSRIEQLNHNIYIITSLIQNYMHDYIYVEVHQLAVLQQQISGHVIITILITGFVSIALVLFLLWYSLKFTHSITRPIQLLCKKAERLGAADFTVVPLNIQNTEIKTLDDGFNEMVGRINMLLKHVKDDQKALRKAEMELLQAQINPHFLYNTFDSIVWLAEMHKDDEVVQMTTSLSTFFRNSLSKGKDIITLETEKQQVESYLEIQKIRYRDILDYEISIPEGLLNYMVPKLTLQPLVENSIYHGIKNKRGKGMITITGKAKGDEILLSVHDNGAGMTEEQLETLRIGVYEDHHTGLGLVNVHKRLRIYCGEEYGLTFESVLGEGTTVTVHIPK